jgi:hypothetical protein
MLFMTTTVAIFDKTIRWLISIMYYRFDFDFWCLTPLSAIFQLYHGDQF